MSKNNYAVFGLGAFGAKLAVELSRAGNNVVVVDLNPERVNDLREKVTEAIVADVSNEEVIRELDVKKFDAIILGMSSHFEDLVLALTLLKQEGAAKVLAKAGNQIQERILYRLGADEVIQPEQDVDLVSIGQREINSGTVTPFPGAERTGNCNRRFCFCPAAGIRQPQTESCLRGLCRMSGVREKTGVETQDDLPRFSRGLFRTADPGKCSVAGLFHLVDLNLKRIVFPRTHPDIAVGSVFIQAERDFFQFGDQFRRDILRSRRRHQFASGEKGNRWRIPHR